IESVLGKGTTVAANFVLSHIDRAPLGDLQGTITALIRLNPDRDFLFRHSIDQRSVTVDTRVLRNVLGEIALNTPEVMSWISEYIDEQEKTLSGLLPGKTELL
ncbi:MAG TPA: ATP-binding protein, partial [Ruminococcaceae bacterium]|nr:ATP-binding protein [Oscillospiraceae bacterium]